MKLKTDPIANQPIYISIIKHAFIGTLFFVCYSCGEKSDPPPPAVVVNVLPSAQTPLQKTDPPPPAPPTITDIADLTSPRFVSIPSIVFTVGDQDTPLWDLALSATSSNSNLVPNSAIKISASTTVDPSVKREARTLQITPVFGLIGTSIIRVTVSDGVLSIFDEFSLKIESCPSGHTNSLPIVRVFGSHDRDEFPVSNTVDGNPGTFMTTPTLTLGQVINIYYKLNTPTDLRKIAVADDYTNDYNMGDLTVLVSKDSTTGIDGTWETVANMRKADSGGFVFGEGEFALTSACVKWVHLKMGYTGTGAHGFSPSFYLSEIQFFGD